MWRYGWLSALCCMVAVVTLGGCSRPTVEGRPALAAASGTVLYQQKPVEGATVLFIPVDHGYAATGRTDANGKFQLRTFDPDDGAAPGKFTVTVRKFEILFPPGGGEIERQLLPEKYGAGAQSGLTAEVSADDDNVFQFELTD